MLVPPEVTFLLLDFLFVCFSFLFFFFFFFFFFFWRDGRCDANIVRFVMAKIRLSTKGCLEQEKSDLLMSPSQSLKHIMVAELIQL